MVVTIVVLLILAGITITYVLGDNSIFKQALEAKIQTELAKIEERAQTIYSEKSLENLNSSLNAEVETSQVIEQLKAEGYTIKRKGAGTVTGISLDKESLTMGTNEIAEIKVTYEGNTNSFAYYVEVQGKYYEMHSNKGFITIDRESSTLTKADFDAEDGTEGAVTTLNVESSDETVATVALKNGSNNIIEVASKEKEATTGIMITVTYGSLEPKTCIVKVKVPSIYAKLYNDGTLAFSSENNVDINKGDYTDYGNIIGHAYTKENLPPWSGKVKSVVVYDEIKPIDTSYWFYNASTTNALTSIDVRKMNTSNTKSMKAMFWNCTGITSLDLSNFDTSNVETMEGMFFRCNKLISLDLRNFNTSKVTTMQDMFIRCESLTDLNISSFDTKNVTSMQAMFRACTNLPSIDVSNFDTSMVTNMSGMFAVCEKLTSLNLNNFNTENVTTMEEMFLQCKSLENLDVNNFNTEKVINVKAMFNACKKLKILDLSSFELGNNVEYGTATSGDNFVQGCTTLEIIYVKDVIMKSKIDGNKQIGWGENLLEVIVK